ncbi:capsule biosynthesis protein [Halomonas binhaiensis]|uniref:Capsular biosynthesis protein n=1 Tax=Halomonas binhaiensis TaxID=2562282 RepID=A0A5C1NCX0_9GAMM|nr:capsular biosynthesis protein [Halomonas binhaiensis]QEM80308.1 capsular biosynthesis protein [Halomonas binhaiensis]
MTFFPRSFLILQGPCSRFSETLACALQDQGHCVGVLNFNGGDLLYRWRLGQRIYRHSADALGEFLHDLYSRESITDQLLFGDQRPVHRPATTLAPSFGIHSHVFEEGYLRPFWITMEQDGVNAHSRLPRNADWYHEAFARLGPAPQPQRFHCAFWKRATHDVMYHLAGLANPVVAPGYRTHAPVTAPVEFTGYIRRFAMLKWHKPRDAERIRQLMASKQPYFVLPLQLNGDAQIRQHSPFRDMCSVLDLVMGSFARHAPGDARLVIKNHPLDMGLMPYRRHIEELAQHLAIQDRIDYLESGDLNHLLRHAQGMVTVNSTSGIVALEHDLPTLALGDAIYAFSGLTQTTSLDDFWRHPQPPNKRLFNAFRQTLLHTVQRNGGFYCQQGIRLAVANCLPDLNAEVSPLEELLSCLPNAA